MNQTIDLLRKHRSIRKYKPTPIPEVQLQEILLAAQAASTSSNIQAYSVIVVRNADTKSKLAVLAGNQKHIDECPVFLVWCADLYKIGKAIHMHEDVQLQTNVERFLLGTVDATLAAQNAAIAAESLGYGIVYIGGIRNNPQEVSNLLELPPLVYPVFGMCIGSPAHEPSLRPRMPLDSIYHHEVYRDQDLLDQIRNYNDTTQQYYATRTGGTKDTIWSRQMLSRFNDKDRMRNHLHDFLKNKGFDLK